MKITCATVGEFIEHLTSVHDAGGSAVLGHICLSLMVRELSDYRYALTCQVTCLMDTGAGVLYLLACGEDCGMDHTDGEQDLQGTNRFAELETQIRETAERFGHKVLPGVIEI